MILVGAIIKARPSLGNTKKEFTMCAAILVNTATKYTLTTHVETIETIHGETKVQLQSM